jgi:hypothetical protein
MGPRVRTELRCSEVCAVTKASARGVLLGVMGSAAALSGGAVRAADEVALDPLLARVGARVIRYFESAQSVMSTETVVIQPLNRSMGPEGRPRRLVYDFRLMWDAPIEGALPEARVVRELVTVDGRRPRDGEPPDCLDPLPVTPEPLSMLLPRHRGEYAFSLGRRTGRVGGRAATVVDYRALASGEPHVTWAGDCVRVSIDGRTRGRIWIDTESSDVLRLDEHLSKPVAFPVPAEHAGPRGVRVMRVERSDTSIRYRPVEFREPDETLLLPTSIETVSVFSGSGVPRLRVVQTFSGYQRFQAESRLLR